MTETVIMVTPMDLENIREKLGALIGDVTSDEPQAHKRRRIVRAGAELFVSQGYRKTSVAEIAKRAGIAKGTIYLYYKTKNDILLAAVAVEKLEYLSAFSKAFDETAPPRQRLRELLFGGLTVATRAPLTARLIEGDQELEAVMAEAPPEFLAENQAQSDEVFAELLTAAVAPAEIDLTTIQTRARALGAVLLVGPLLRTVAKHTTTTEDALAHALTDILLDGISSAPTKSSRK